MSASNSIRRFFNFEPQPGGSGAWRRWLILAGVGFLGLLVGVGIGASGQEKTSTVTVAGGVTTVRVATRAPTRTVTRTVVHVHVHTHTVTQTVTVPAAGSSAGNSGAGEGEAAGKEDEVGSTSHATDGQFCSEHECIGDFEGENGTIVECSDGTYSHAGGISGACSDHGGES